MMTGSGVNLYGLRFSFWTNCASWQVLLLLSTISVLTVAARYSQEDTHYQHIYHHFLHQFPKLVDHFPVAYGSGWALQNQASILPLIAIFILCGHSETQIPLKVFEFLQQLPSTFNNLSQFPWAGRVLLGVVGDLFSFAARHCINSLMHDSSLKSSAFALEILPLLLPNSRLSSGLNEACFPDRAFAYAATEYHGLSGLAYRTCIAMQQYGERYAKAQLLL